MYASDDRFFYITGSVEINIYRPGVYGFEYAFEENTRLHNVTYGSITPTVTFVGTNPFGGWSEVFVAAQLSSMDSEAILKGIAIRTSWNSTRPKTMHLKKRDGTGVTCDDSCQWSNDGVCDEPGYCNAGTDCHDCGPVGESTTVSHQLFELDLNVEESYECGVSLIHSFVLPR